MSLSKRKKDECRRGAAALLALALTAAPAVAADDKPKAEPAAPAKISYDKQVRPIFQAHCQGCHQPAKAGGDYVMTSFDKLLKGGESGDPAVAPGKPGESHLIEAITPHDGKSEMPRNKPPLNPTEIELIAQWIAQGAVDDTPQGLILGGIPADARVIVQGQELVTEGVEVNAVEADADTVKKLLEGAEASTN